METKTFLGRYRVCVDRNGLPLEFRRGPNGVTYKAEAIDSAQPVTLELIRSWSPREIAPRDKLEAEAKTAMDLVHVNIARLIDFGFEGDQLVYVSEYLEGTTAADWVIEHGPMPVGAVLRIALQFVSALGGAAFHQLVHRAIQPANLMIVPGQTAEGDWPLVKILNFGRVSPTVSATEASHLHPDNAAKYASPEQLRGDPVDFRSEIYSLGATLLFLLTGAPPFATPGDPLGLRQSKKSVAVERFSEVPKVVRRLVMQMLAVNPDDRQQDPLALEEQILNCLARVEQRQAFGPKLVPPLVAPIPAARPVRAAAAAALVDHSTRRSTFLKPFAITAVLGALAALAALALPQRFGPSWFRQARSQQEPIGVPVGIPEAQANAVASIAPVTANAATAPIPGQAQPASSPAAVAGPSVVANRTNDFPVVTSSAIATTNGKNASPAPIGLPTVVAASPSKSPPVVASNIPPPATAAEPLPPAEGPDDLPVPSKASDIESNAGEETVRNQTLDLTSDGPWAESSASSSEEKRAVTTTKSRERTSAVAKSQSKSKKRRLAKVRSGGNRIPGVESGSMRARFVGTTPDGKWVLALPSGRTVVAEPAPSSNVYVAPRRRYRRVIVNPDASQFRAPPPWFTFPPDA